MFSAAIAQAGLPMVVTDSRRPDDLVAFANPAFSLLNGCAADRTKAPLLAMFRHRRYGDPKAPLGRPRRRVRHGKMVNYGCNRTPFRNVLFSSPARGWDSELLHSFGNPLDVRAQCAADAAARGSQKREASGRLTSGTAHAFNNRLLPTAGNLEPIDADARSRVAPGASRRNPSPSPARSNSNAALST